MTHELIIVAGGQTGADLAGLISARRHGIPTEGWAAKGWAQCDIHKHWVIRSAPWLVDYGLKEHPSEGFAARTVANVEMSDAVALFGNPNSPGGKLLRATCKELSVPVFGITKGAVKPSELATWIVGENPLERPITRLMIAGNRETEGGAFQARCEAFLDRTFALLGHRQAGGGADVGPV